MSPLLTFDHGCLAGDSDFSAEYKHSMNLDLKSVVLECLHLH